MKKTLFALLALAGLAHGTTVVGSGGTTGAQFATNTGVLLTNTNSTFQFGSYNATTNVFTAFALTDITPVAISTSASLVGRWAGNFADTSTDANAFNGQPIWVRITVDLGGGQTGSAVFGSTVTFPTNGGGVGDSVNLPASSLTIIDQDNSTLGSAAFAAADGTYTNGHITVGVIPEPSVALLGALGVLGLIRRRR